ncbi:hypothetical protein I546_6240 [Mycobacterium kansasii 732]|nr:hypothetical protein I546_6240 [Mycobacterium kansasii 732]
MSTCLVFGADPQLDWCEAAQTKTARRGRAVLDRTGKAYWLGGINTVSIMYTVALAV